MDKSWKLSRRTLLRGSTAALALPLLDVMGPTSLFAARSFRPPVRSAFFYINNGIYMPDWTPSGEGYKYALSPDLKELESVRNEVLVISQLANAQKQLGGLGGDHVRSRGSYLTGVPINASGQEVKLGVSIDQHIAKAIGHETYLPSLEVGTQALRADGACDMNSCAYYTTISWRTPTSPMPMERNPQAIFDRLFRGQPPEVPDWEMMAQRAKQRPETATAAVAPAAAPDLKYHKSVLDEVMQDAKSLQGKVSSADRNRLEEYLDSVRSVEKRLEFTAQKNPDAGRTVGVEKSSNLARPLEVKIPDRGIPQDYTQYVTLLQDLMILAFQTDTTRVATCMLINNRYPVAGADGEHHEWSHHGGDKSKQDKLKLVDQYRVGLFVDMVKKLKSLPEAGGTVLDNCMLMFGSGFGDGNRHDGFDIPILLAGKGGGTLKPGRHIKESQRTPLTNLFVEMSNRMGVRTQKFGDSDGGIKGLA